MTPPGKTILYGDIQVPVFTRDWLRTPERLPYRKTYLLKPGQRWEDAPFTPTLWEHYVHLPNGAIPSGAAVAQELIAEGAVAAVWTECYGRGRLVLMSPGLVCIEQTGELCDILQQIRVANGGRWAGLPDAVGLFPEGRIAMREAKVAGKDRLSPSQHAFARAARQLFGSRIDFAVVEWGRGVAQ